MQHHQRIVAVRAFLALRQHFHPLHIIERLLALLEGDDVGDAQVELHMLQYWTAADRFDRSAVNRQLRQEVATPTIRASHS
jgi:hypothetical protein